MSDDRTSPPSVRLSDLELFLCIVDAGNQARACELTNIPQWEMSRRMKAVAHFFEQDLFARGKGRVSEINQHGKTIEPKVRAAVSLIKEAKNEVRRSRNIRVGFSSVGRSALAQAVGEFQKSHPDGGRVEMREATAREYLNLLWQRDLDVALGYQLKMDEVERMELSTFELAEHTRKLAVPVALKSEVDDVDALNQLSWCFMRRELVPEAYDRCVTWLRKSGYEQKIDESNDCVTAGEVLAKVGTGRFFSILPLFCEHGAGPDIAFVPARGLQGKAKFCAYYSPALAERLAPFLQTLRSVCRQVR